MKQRRGPAGSRRSISPSIRAGLPFLPEGVLPGLGWLPGQRERRQGGAAFLLLVPLRLRLRAASSSQPGRSAWRAGSRASRGKRLQAAAAGRHASLRLQGVSGDAPR